MAEKCPDFMALFSAKQQKLSTGAKVATSTEIRILTTFF
jgi:hypothetical protein